MHERHEEYMKRRMREEEIPAKIHNVKNIMSLLMRGKTVYERDFGTTNRTKIKDWVDSFVNDPGDLEVQ